MTISELDKQIKPNMRGAYLFYGEEEYLKHRYREKMRSALLEDDSLAPFNHSMINELSRLAGEVETLPMMADRRFVEVEDVSFTKLNKDATKALLTLLQKTEDTVVLFFTREGEFSAGTQKKPSELYKKLSEVCHIVEFSKQAPNRLATWAAKHFASHGTFAEAELCHALIERCGTDMNVLANEIAKLSAYALAHGENRIRHDMIPLVVTAYRESGAFDFVNAIMDGNTAYAFALFTDMKRRREKPVEICAAISRVISELKTIKTYADAGLSLAEIAAATKTKEYSVKLRLAALRTRSDAELDRAVSLCYETDLKLKSRSVDKYFLIEKLILDLSGQGE